MGSVINLSRYRKEKQAAERERRANEKRVRFGIPKNRAQQERRRAGLGNAPPRRHEAGGSRAEREE